MTAKRMTKSHPMKEIESPSAPNWRALAVSARGR
jgi:hypothetical protein